MDIIPMPNCRSDEDRAMIRYVIRYYGLNGPHMIADWCNEEVKPKCNVSPAVESKKSSSLRQ